MLNLFFVQKSCHYYILSLSLYNIHIYIYIHTIDFSYPWPRQHALSLIHNKSTILGNCECMHVEESRQCLPKRVYTALGCSSSKICDWVTKDTSQEAHVNHNPSYLEAVL